MPIRVDAYITGGVASGVLARTGHLREVLESGTSLTLERVSWQAIDGSAARSVGQVDIPVDDVLVAVSHDDDATVPVHASWHAIRLETGPYRVEGELPTLPGFDPGRALTRPTGEFVLLRDVRLARLIDPGPGVTIGGHALVNRYSVDRISADLMLGFFFPGAVIDGAASTAGVSAPASSATA